MTTYYVGAEEFGSELFTNNDFGTNDSTGWSFSDGNWAVSNYQLVGTGATGNAFQTLALTPGKVYRQEVNLVALSAGSFYIVNEGNNILSYVHGSYDSISKIVFYFETIDDGAGGSGLNGIIACNCTIDSMSMKECVVGGDGTTTPWKGLVSIGNGVTLQPGDEIIITENQYGAGINLDGIDGTSANPITIRMAPGVSLTRPMDEQVLDSHGIRLNDCDHIIIDGFRADGAFKPSNYHLPASAYRSEGILVDTTCNNITIANCTINNFPGHGFNTEGSASPPNYDISLLNNTFIGNGVKGIGHGGRSTARWSTKIIGNTVIKNGSGISTENGDGNGISLNVGNAYCAYNYIERNGDPNATEIEDFDISSDGTTGYADGEPRWIIGNYLKDCIHGGIQLFYGSDDCVVSHNIINGFNQHDSGSTYGSCAGLRIGTTGPTDYASDSNISVYNNIFTRNGNGATGAAVSPCILFGFAGSTTPGNAHQNNLTFLNNIFYDCEGMFWFIDDIASITGLLIDHNLYWNSNGVYASNAWHAGQMTGGSTYSTFAAWQATGASALNSPDKNGKNEDPLLDDLFNPSTYSPCLNAGETPLYKIDIYSKLNYGPHIGACWPHINTRKTRRSF